MTTKEDNMGYYMHPLLLKLPGYILESQPIEFANDVKLQWEILIISKDNFKVKKIHRVLNRCRDGMTKDCVTFTSLGGKCDGYQPQCWTPHMHIMVFLMPECMIGDFDMLS